MKNEMVEVLNQETGERGSIRRRLFESPVFNPGILVEVPTEQKPYHPLTFKSRVETEPKKPREPRTKSPKVTEPENAGIENIEEEDA